MSLNRSCMATRRWPVYQTTVLIYYFRTTQSIFYVGTRIKLTDLRGNLGELTLETHRFAQRVVVQWGASGELIRSLSRITPYDVGVWGTGSDDVGLIQSTKAPKHHVSELFPTEGRGLPLYVGLSQNLKDPKLSNSPPPTPLFFCFTACTKGVPLSSETTPP